MDILKKFKVKIEGKVEYENTIYAKNEQEAEVKARELFELNIFGNVIGFSITLMEVTNDTR